jgi:hypothetical protein
MLVHWLSRGVSSSGDDALAARECGRWHCAEVNEDLYSRNSRLYIRAVPVFSSLRTVQKIIVETVPKRVVRSEWAKEEVVAHQRVENHRLCRVSTSGLLTQGVVNDVHGR